MVSFADENEVLEEDEKVCPGIVENVFDLHLPIFYAYMESVTVQGDSRSLPFKFMPLHYLHLE